jgi:hypothetical protein
MKRSKPELSGFSGCVGVLSMLGDGLGKALSFGFPQISFFVGGGKDWTFGQWTLLFEFSPHSSMRFIYRLDIGHWTLLFEFSPHSSMRFIYRLDIGHWTLLFEFSPHSSMRFIYRLDIGHWTLLFEFSPHSSMRFIYGGVFMYL